MTRAKLWSREIKHLQLHSKIEPHEIEAQNSLISIGIERLACLEESYKTTMAQIAKNINGGHNGKVSHSESQFAVPTVESTSNQWPCAHPNCSTEQWKKEAWSDK